MGTTRQFRDPINSGVLIAACLWSALCSAQDTLPLQMEVDVSSFYSRSCAPVPLYLKTQWDSERILEGELLLEFKDASGDRLLTLNIDDFFVSPGAQTIPLLLPPFRHSFDEQIDVLATIRSNGKSWPLLPMTLRVPGIEKRTTVVTVGIPEVALQHDGGKDWVQWLTLDKIQPDVSQALGYRGNQPVTLIPTLVSTTAVQNFPTDPHWHCVSDIVVLPPEGISKIEELRFETLLAWVRAGGSLCVLLGDHSIPTPIVEKLNELMSEESERSRLVTDREGNVLWDVQDLNLSRPGMFRFGLGRVVLGRIAADQPPVARTLEWLEAAAFLWKFRKTQVEHVRYNGNWSYQPTNQFNGARGLLSDYNPQPVPGGMGLMQRMLPQGLKVFPLWLLGTIGSLYILAIGPLDYIVLGRLNARKYTWIVFPSVTLGFLLATLGISQAFIQSGDHQGKVVFRDISPGGVVARENELQLLFSGSNKTAETTATRSLLSAMRYQDFGTVQNPFASSSQQTSDDIAPTVYRGRMPVEITAVQGLTQWTPQLNRLMKIPRQALQDDSGFNWDTPIDVDSADGQNQLRQRIAQTFGDGTSAIVYGGGGGWQQMQQMQQIQPHDLTEGLQLAKEIVLLGNPQIFESVQSEYGIYQINAGVGYQQVRRDFSKVVSARTDGLFTVVSQVSPMGGHRFEDLAILDIDDSDALLLLIAREEPDRLVIYRKLYRKSRR